MMKQPAFLFLTSILFAIFSLTTAIAQNLAKDNFIWKRDIQVSVGYPILNSFKTRKYFTLYNKVDNFNSKKYPYLEITLSHKIVNAVKCVLGLSYYQNEIIGPDYQMDIDKASSSNRYYNLYQIVKSKDLRLLVLLSCDQFLKPSRLIRGTIGLGCHIYPQRNGDAELTVSNYYSEIQDTTITCFPALAINKKSYRTTGLLGTVNPIVKLDYYNSAKSKVNIFLGVVFSYIYVPFDTDVSIYQVFDGENIDDYAINYNFSRQLIFGIHLGVNFHSKSSTAKE